MEYKVTARKWRPQTFSEIVGQETITKAIKNSILSGKIPHAFLFSGSRGVGKTTTARIIAKALNCKNLKNGEPCNTCSSCIDISNGNSLDVIEIDGASNRGIDDIRQIRDNVVFSPLGGKYKIYIIDEVHMLTNDASNALLKTLEEPPSHVIFILATTEPQNVLPTIRSRCQHYNFKKISTKAIVKQLEKICKAENINYDCDGLYAIALCGEGSMRDAESLFDQAVLFTEGNLYEKNVNKIIGSPDFEYYKEIIEGLLNKDSVRCLKILNRYLNDFSDLKYFTKELINFLRDGVLVKKLPENDELLDLSENKYNILKNLFSNVEDKIIISLINFFSDAYRDLKSDIGERFIFELYLFKAINLLNSLNINFSLSPTTTTVSKPDEDNKDIKDNEDIKDNKIEYKKININIQTENKTPDKTNTNLKEELLNIIKQGKISSTMSKDIKNIEEEQDKLIITITTQHSYEYFLNVKPNYEKKLSEIFNRNIRLNITLQENKNELIDFTNENERKTIEPPLNKEKLDLSIENKEMNIKSDNKNTQGTTVANKEKKVDNENKKTKSDADYIAERLDELFK